MRTLIGAVKNWTSFLFGFGGKKKKTESPPKPGRYRIVVLDEIEMMTYHGN